MNDVVEVIIRGKNGQIIRQETMDRDSAYFQDFRQKMEQDLAEGSSITIIPRQEFLELEKSRAKWSII